MSYGPGPNLAGSLFMSSDNYSGPDSDSQGAAGTDEGCGGDDGGGGGSMLPPPPPTTPQPAPAPPPGNSSCLLSANKGGGKTNSSNGGLNWFDYGLIPPPPLEIVPFSDGGSTSCPPAPGLPPGCVVAGTRIALFPDGCAAAGELKVGDVLLTRTAAGEAAGEAVTAIIITRQPCLCVETDDGRELHCSLTHEVMVEDEALLQGRRTVVSDLTLSDRLLREDGAAVRIGALARTQDATVYQISLAGPEHLYLSEGLWSHNKLYPVPPSGGPH